MKRAILLAGIFVILVQGMALGQEREPLAMRISFEWTVAGAMGGAALGVLLWLTDPANPNNQLSDSVAIGAAWGTVVGVGFSAFVMQRNAIIPAQARVDSPLDPRNRISPDPVGQQEGESLLASLGMPPARGGPGVRVPVFQLKF